MPQVSRQTPNLARVDAAHRGTENIVSALRQFIKQRLSLLQIKGIEAFGEPAVDRSEKIAGLYALALVAPEPRHARCRAEFEQPRLLAARNLNRLPEGGLSRIPVSDRAGE